VIHSPEKRKGLPPEVQQSKNIQFTNYIIAYLFHICIKGGGIAHE